MRWKIIINYSIILIIYHRLLGKEYNIEVLSLDRYMYKKQLEKVC